MSVDTVCTTKYLIIVETAPEKAAGAAKAKEVLLAYEDYSWGLVRITLLFEVILYRRM